MRALRWSIDASTTPPRWTLGWGEAPAPKPPPGWSAVRVRLALLEPGMLHRSDIRGTEPRAITGGRAFVGVEPQNEQRVVGDAHVPCARCERCLQGLSEHCAHALLPGVRGLDGCWSPVCVLPARSLAVVPPSIDDRAALLLPMLARALRAVRDLGLPRDALATVVGDDELAFLCALALSHTIDRPRLLTTVEPSLAGRWADHAGLRHRPVHDASLAHDQSAVIDCTGREAVIAHAAGMCVPRGSIVVLRDAPIVPDIHADLASSGAPGVLRAMIEHEIRVVGSRAGHAAEAVRWLATRPNVTLPTPEGELEPGDARALAAVVGPWPADSPGMCSVLRWDRALAPSSQGSAKPTGHDAPLSEARSPA